MSKKNESIPLVGLIGIPNSGKSTLLNKICGKRTAITANEAHTTRDLNYGEDIWNGFYIKFVDTGGLVPDPDTEIQKQTQIKSWGAIAEADVLVWVIDRKQDVDTIREKLLQKIWKTGKPLIIAINKVDDPNFDREISEYVQLGAADFVNLSATTGYGVDRLMDAITNQLEKLGFEKGNKPSEFFLQNQREVEKKGRKMKRINYAEDGSIQVTRERNSNGINMFNIKEMQDPRVNRIDTLFFSKNFLEENRDFVKSSLESGYDCYDIVDMHEIEEIIRNEGLDSSRSVVIIDNPAQRDEIINIGAWAVTVVEEKNYTTEIEKIEGGFLDREPKIPKILLLGRPNVGKSSLFNALCREDIQIVTETAGTTLSVNDYLIEQPERGKKYLLMDTTGIRKPGKRTFGAETFATYRTVQSAHEADVVCLVLDSSESLTNQDQIVAGIVKEAHKGVVVIANKSDLIQDEDDRAKFIKDFGFKFQFLKVQKFVWVSAKEWEDSSDEMKKEKDPGNIKSIWTAVDAALKNRRKYINKADVRKLFDMLMKFKPPKKLKVKRKPIIYDLRYTRSEPPTFELLLRDKTTIHWSYVRFLENQIRKRFDITSTGIAIRLIEVDRRNILE